MSNLKEQMIMSNIAREALDNARKNKCNEPTVTLESTYRNIDRVKHVFEEYTENNFKLKIALEKFIYESFIKKVEDNQVALIQETLGNLMQTVNNIYKHINIKPKIYGFMETDIELSNSKISEKADEIVMKHLNESYYNLSSLQRKNRYEESVIAFAKEIMVDESISADDAIEHAYKTIVIENLLRKISIPSIINSRIDDLLESDDYRIYCDQDELLNLVESFGSQIHNLARVFALTI